MKKPLVFILSLCLVVALAACGGTPASQSASTSPQASSSASEPASIFAPASAEPASGSFPAPTGDVYILGILEPLFSSYQGEEPALPDFLDEVQQAQYFAAFILTCEMNGFGTGFGGDGTGETLQDGAYVKCNGAITRGDELSEIVEAVFTEECYNALNQTDTDYPLFIVEDGDLYQNTGGRGGNIEYEGPDTFELVSQDEDEIAFELVGHYADTVSKEPYTTSYPIAMVNTDEGWRLSEFAITF